MMKLHGCFWHPRMSLVLSFNIETVPDNHGRTYGYHFRLGSEEEWNEYTEPLIDAFLRAPDMVKQSPGWEPTPYRSLICFN